jgi:uncharacterized protein (TIGR02453 family)
MFQGFPEGYVPFLIGLKLNNHKAWFEAHRAEFEACLKGPMTALVEAVAPAIQAIDPALDTRPARCIARIHRDTRFSGDKSPYRDHLWLAFRRPGASMPETCSLYFEISATAAHWGCGFYEAGRPLMDSVRRVCRETPSRLLSLLEDPAFAQRFSLEGEAYKRMAVPPEVPEALRFVYIKRNVFAQRRGEDALLLRPTLADVLREDFQILAPFYHFLQDCAATQGA